jgi:hypothetical protein
MYFHPPSNTCRIFPNVLDIALLITARNRLDELTFDVDVTRTGQSNSDSDEAALKNVLSSPVVDRIPNVQFHVLRNRGSESVDVYCRQFALFMRERELVVRDVIYTAEGAQFPTQ